MLYRTVAYLKFLKKSTNEHGVHSPFVYDLITKCFYVKPKKTSRNQLNTYLSFLNKNEKIIEVEDFGAGSTIFKNNQRAVSRIAQVASVQKTNALLLERLIKYLNIERILELGTSLGVATASMSFANSKAKITTLEGCRNIANEAMLAFEKFQLKNIEVKVGEFLSTLPSVLNKSKYDLIYFDGNHTKEATLSYFQQALHTIHNDSLFIFDDIHWNRGMEEAWEEIKKNEKVKVTIDTFQWGFVFFRKEQVKEHFVIRL